MTNRDGSVTLQKKQRERLTDDVRAADHHRLASRKRHAVMLEKPDYAGRRARHELRLARKQRAEVRMMKAVDILRRRYRLEHARGVHVLRQRQLHQDAVQRGIGVERGDALEELVLAYRRWILVQARVHAGLLRGEHLVLHVHPGGGVIAREDHGESGAHAALHKFGHLVLQLGANRCREGFPVQDLRCHGARQSSIGPIFWLSLPGPPQHKSRAGEPMSAVPQFPAANDPDALETQEWLDALEAVLEREGPERAHFLLERLIDKARRSGAYIPFSANTAYINTIPPHMEERSPGDVTLEERIRSICRWNAMVLVARANKNDDELGGHIASFASVGTLFGTGQQHFWNAPHDGHGGDLIYFQCHSSPGVYARSLMGGRLPPARL